MPLRDWPAPREWQRLAEQWLLLACAALVLALALLDPRPLAAHLRWLQLPTLAGLAGVSIPFLLVCAPLVCLAYRLL